MIEAAQLAKKIADFLSVYADVRPDYDAEFDGEDERFTSPDASILFAAQKILETNSALPAEFSVDSSWESGGYSPYTDAAGKALHNEIVSECRMHITA